MSEAGHQLHPAYHRLDGWRITVADDGDRWLMTAKRHQRRTLRIWVSKADVPAERIEAHARTTFAAILPGSR